MKEHLHAAALPRLLPRMMWLFTMLFAFSFCLSCDDMIITGKKGATLLIALSVSNPMAVFEVELCYTDNERISTGTVSGVKKLRIKVDFNGVYYLYYRSKAASSAPWKLRKIEVTGDENYIDVIINPNAP